MTTKVTIFNHGPGNVSLVTVDAFSKTENTGVAIPPGVACDQYVHLHQELKVVEVSTSGPVQG